ncbi:MAG: ABC transporter ATP-binding protein [Verrucomicrobia bacterium]|nr:ABC transporter ATP-binding protein [Verrucomicrobiota bacterium]
MIELKQVSRRYRQGDNLVVALDRVNLGIAAGEFVAITGESGSGKSTLLHLLGGLDRPDEGEIWVDGVAVGSASEKELTKYRREKLGIVFQFFNLLPTLTVLENVALPLQLQGQRLHRAEARARELLDLVDLAKRAGHFTFQLSGGEMQRAAVARALAHRPRLLLADEPTGNLDEVNAGRIMALFGAIDQQRLATLVVVTHSPEVAAQARRVVRLRNGRIEADVAGKGQGHGRRPPVVADDDSTSIGHPVHG